MGKTSDRKTAKTSADKQTEANLLCSIMLEPAEIGPVIERVTEECFFYPAHKTIFRAILALYTRPAIAGDDIIDADAVWTRLESTGNTTTRDTDAEEPVVSCAYFQHLTKLAPSIANIGYYVDLILERSKDRRLQRMTDDIENIADQPGESEEKMRRIQQKVLQLDSRKTEAKVISLGDSLVQHARDLHGDAPGRVDTGFFPLDQHIGGFYPGDLVVIAARSSMGKTSLALNIALNAAIAGTGVLFISLEMTVPQLRSRALCMLAGLPLAEVRYNPYLENEKKKKLLQAAEKYQKKSPPLFITNAGHTPEEQTMLLKQYARTHKIGLVVIDYFQLMITDHRQQNLRHMATELSRAVKRIAQTENIPVILTSQLGPEAEDGKNIHPRMADLREYGTVDQDADIIMLLFREDYYRRRDESYGPIEAFEIDIAKHRNGPTGHVKLMFDKEKMMFSDGVGLL